MVVLVLVLVLVLVFGAGIGIGIVGCCAINMVFWNKCGHECHELLELENCYVYFDYFGRLQTKQTFSRNGPLKKKCGR